MSLRARILTRAGAMAGAARLSPKDRGAGSAFGLRRTGAPDPEIDRTSDLAAAAPRREDGAAQSAAALHRATPDADPEERPDPVARQYRPSPSAVARVSRSEDPSEDPEDAMAARSQAVTAPVAPATPDGPSLAADRIAAPAAPMPPLTRVETVQPPEEEPAPEMRNDPQPQHALAMRAPLPQNAATGPAPGPEGAPDFAAVQQTAGPNQFPPPADQRPAPEASPAAFAPEPQGHIQTDPQHSPDRPRGQRPESHVGAAILPVVPPLPAPEQRPQVIIDQIDVLIADSQPSQASARAPSAASALLSRRWLRR